MRGIKVSFKRDLILDEEKDDILDIGTFVGIFNDDVKVVYLHPETFTHIIYSFSKKTFQPLNLNCTTNLDTGETEYFYGDIPIIQTKEIKYGIVKIELEE